MEGAGHIILTLLARRAAAAAATMTTTGRSVLLFYLGRSLEGEFYAAIVTELGSIRHYAHTHFPGFGQRLPVVAELCNPRPRLQPAQRPLVIIDDDVCNNLLTQAYAFNRQPPSLPPSTTISLPTHGTINDVSGVAAYTLKSSDVQCVLLEKIKSSAAASGPR